MTGRNLTESELQQIERASDPTVIPELVRMIQSQQHELDRLRLSMDVTRQERDELRMELVKARRAPKDESPDG